MKSTSIRRFLPLLAMVLIALFPLGWLAQLNQIAAVVINTLFATDAMHAVGHIGIFLLLGLAVLVAFPALQRRPLWFVAGMLAIGAGQEFFQHLYKQVPIGFDEWRDLGTDMIGTVLALAVIRLWAARRGPARQNTP